MTGAVKKIGHLERDTNGAAFHGFVKVLRASDPVLVAIIISQKMPLKGKVKKGDTGLRRRSHFIDKLTSAQPGFTTY